MDNYSQLIERISISAKLSKEDIERKIEAKRAKLSGLVSKEGAAQIVAAELGINFDKERMKISELVQGMKRANFVGKVINISPIRSFNKNGREFIVEFEYKSSVYLHESLESMNEYDLVHFHAYH